MKNTIFLALLLVPSSLISVGSPQSPYTHLSAEEQQTKLSEHYKKLLLIWNNLNMHSLFKLKINDNLNKKINFLTLLFTQEAKRKGGEHLNALYFIMKDILTIFCTTILDNPLTLELTTENEAGKTCVELHIETLDNLLTLYPETTQFNAFSAP